MDLDEMLHVDRCRDMDELINFEPDPDHSSDAGTGLLSPISYRLRNFAALPRLPATCAATRNFTSVKSHVYVLARTSRGFKMVLFTEPPECALLSSFFLHFSVFTVWGNYNTNVAYCVILFLSMYIKQ